MPPARCTHDIHAPRVVPAAPPVAATTLRLRDDESGSLVTEYGLLAILGATITGLAIKWASGGAIFALFGAVFSKVRALVGA